MFLKKYLFGDTAVYYVETPLEGHAGRTVTGLFAYPRGWDVQTEKLRADSLVQASFTGDTSLLSYANGVTQCARSSSLVPIEEQTADEKGVTTALSDGNGNYYLHHLEYDAISHTFGVWIEYENRSKEPRTLEKLPSLCLSGFFALSQGGNSTAGLTLHRMTSAWSRECRLQSLSFSALGLEASWARYGVKCERWGQVGSMPNRGYYPFAAVEDRDAGVCLAVTQEAPYSWQIELFGEQEGFSLASGLGDYEFAHWRKVVPAGGKFATHKAYFTVKSNLNAACNALLHGADARLRVPACEESMPVMFNEYCTTWGNPESRNISNILQAVKSFPISYFVIDAGWYKPENKGWDNATGDWRVNSSMFPQGLKAGVRDINAAGMKAGIWFEYEISGRDSELFYRENMHLTRDNAVITAKNRRFLDLRKEEVLSYLGEKVIKPLQENCFGYIKIDYNDAFAYCDGAESPGEGGRQVAEESIAFLNRLKSAVPDLMIENCASGGSRIEPLRMSKVSMCSFSDAHECPELPLVAANVSRVVPARQIQIWAVLRDGEEEKRTVYSLCAAFLGRICLSGDVLKLTEHKRALIGEGLAFYEAVKGIVRDGDIERIDSDVEYYREPFGRQIYKKRYKNRLLVVVHNLMGEREISVPVQGKLARAYTTESYSVQKEELRIAVREYSAGAFLFEI